MMPAIECRECEKSDPDLKEVGDEIKTACCGVDYDVVCPECGARTSDAGSGMGCDQCEDAELPYIDDKGNVVLDGAPFYKVGDVRGR